MRLYAGGYLPFYLPQRKHRLEIRLSAPTPLKVILNDLQVPVEEIHLVALNGELVDLETALVNDADVVRIFSSVNGG